MLFNDFGRHGRTEATMKTRLVSEVASHLGACALLHCGHGADGGGAAVARPRGTVAELPMRFFTRGREAGLLHAARIHLPAVQDSLGAGRIAFHYRVLHMVVEKPLLQGYLLFCLLQYQHLPCCAVLVALVAGGTSQCETFPRPLDAPCR